MHFRLRLGLTLALLLPHYAPAQTPTAAFDTLVRDIREDDLKRSPEFASALGDRRYNDQLTDISPRAVNDRLAAGRNFLTRLLLIDATTLSAQQKLSADLMQRQFIEDEQASRFKEWEMPVQPSHAIQTDLPAMVAYLPFDTVKDYDDYIARLHQIPATLRQASDNLLAGIDDQRVQPASVLEKALAQTEELANAQPEASPFALPLKKFPAAIDAATRKRIAAAMLDAIQTDVLPAYARFAKFLRVTEIPAAKPSANLPDHPFSYELNHRHILELLTQAKSALGPKFDLKAFHDIAVDVPTDTLDRRIDAWIAATK
jgi:uncharacterized protein (DUF885 family)